MKPQDYLFHLVRIGRGKEEKVGECPVCRHLRLHIQTLEAEIAKLKSHIQDLENSREDKTREVIEVSPGVYVVTCSHSIWGPRSCDCPE